jgi:hypothetical protein
MLSAEISPHEHNQEIPDFLDDETVVESDVVVGAPYGAKHGPRTTEKQRKFARAFVLSGGNASAAARAAGYAGSSGAAKALLNGNVQAEIKRLSVLNLEAALPKMMQRALDIALDPKTAPNMALDAIFKLMDRAGLKPKSGPLVQVNNDNRQQTAQFGSNEAQALIEKVWSARSSRLSDIAAPMSDTSTSAAPAQIEAAHTPPGGGASFGAPSRDGPLPPYSDEQYASDELGED